MPPSACVRCYAPLPTGGANFCAACGAPQFVAGPTPVAPPATRAVASGPFQEATVVAGSTAKIHVTDGPRSFTATLAGDAMSLGRRPDNDIVIVAPYVSGRHARLERDGASHRIVDVGSTNGLVFNGEKIAAHALTDGDVVRIPDPSTANFVTLVYENPLAPRETTPRAARRYPTPRGMPLAVLGRAGADIVLDSPLVSRRHAQLGFHADAHFIQDAGSTNGTFVNGTRIRGAVPLRAGDVIQIGPFRLRYDGDSLDEFDQRGAMRIEARSLRRTVPARAGGTRTILDDVSLCIEPREFVALVGGSGAGKSTLMMALSGYLRADAGEVRVNGDDYYAHFDAYRDVLGYVPQDDIIHRMLPVDRALGYAARLKLPADTAPDEIDKRVAHVLSAVEMAAHKDKLIDQLSGGQRKRVSIAAELLNEPSLLFLDEPTSGLDPGLEKKMMYTLRQLADSGRTVVLVTHATANITQCDLVVFMADGRLVYYGPPGEALAFFSVESGDFADIYTLLDGDLDPQSPLAQSTLRNELAQWRAANPNETRPPRLSELWQVRWLASAQHRKYVVDRLGRAPMPAEPPSPSPIAANSTLRHSLLRQFAILTRRYLDLLVQDRRNLALMLLQAPLIGALLCLVSREDVLTAGTQPYDAKKLLFLLATVGVWFGIINSAREICKESSVFRRERMANLRVIPYVASKFAVLTLLVLVQSALLLGVLQLAVSFPDYGALTSAEVELYATTALAGVAGLAFGLLISAFSSTPDKAISAVPLALVPQILFAGLLFKLEGASTVLSWLTASRWAMDAFGSIVNLNAFHWLNGATVPFEEQYEQSAGHLWGCWGLLAGYAAVCSAAIGARLHKRA